MMILVVRRWRSIGTSLLLQGRLLDANEEGVIRAAEDSRSAGVLALIAVGMDLIGIAAVVSVSLADGEEAAGASLAAAQEAVVDSLEAAEEDRGAAAASHAAVAAAEAGPECLS